MDFTVEMESVPYVSGDALYTDRPYVDTEKRFVAEDILVFKTPRHFNRPIKLVLFSKSRVYIPLPAKFHEFYQDWQISPEPFFINGASVKHVQLRYKDYGNQELELPAVSAVASSPIFIQYQNPKSNVKASYLSGFNKFHGSILAHKKKIAAFIAAFFLICYLNHLWFAFRRT